MIELALDALLRAEPDGRLRLGRARAGGRPRDSATLR